MRSTPSSTNAKERLFEQMHEALLAYQNSGHKPELEPDWDMQLYREFRSWQAARLARKVREHHLPLQEAREQRERAASSTMPLPKGERIPTPTG